MMAIAQAFAAAPHTETELKMSEKTQATARVRVTVEVDTSSWGDKCTVEQIMNQASSEAVTKVKGMVHKGGGRIVGDPEVLVSVYWRK